MHITRHTTPVSIRIRWLAAVVAFVAAATGMLSVVGQPAAEAAVLRPPGIVYRSPVDGLAWELGPDAVPVLAGNGLGVEPGTQPVVATFGGGRVIALHGAGVHTLWYIDENNGVHDTGVSMWPGTSPAIAANGVGSWFIAWEGADSRLWTLQAGGVPVKTPSAMFNGPGAPSVVALADGSFEMAFVASNQVLWVANSVSGGHAVTTQFLVDPGSNPSIAADKSGGWQLAVQAMDHREWLADSAGNLTPTPSFLLGGTSPSMAGLASGGYAQAFVAASGVLWTEGPDRSGHSTGHTMAAGTSPAMAAFPSGWQVAFQDAAHTLKVVNQSMQLYDTGLPVSPSNSPDIDWKITAPMRPAKDLLLQTFNEAVNVVWKDDADNETEFQVRKRDIHGAWTTVATVPSRNNGQRGDLYSWTDTGHNVIAQCYRIVDTFGYGIADTPEQCTIRPDPANVPQDIPPITMQWTGLTNLNTGIGVLTNTNNNKQLHFRERTLGVNLEFLNEPTPSWHVTAESGDELMRGQPVALRVGGGGWLTIASPTWGITLGYQNTPTYEWVAVGGVPGTPLANGTFALWNNRMKNFLVYDNTTGVGLVELSWYDAGGGSTPPPPPPPPGVRVLQVFNCSIDHHEVTVWVADLTLGNGWSNLGTLKAQYTPWGMCIEPGSVPIKFDPANGHLYRVVAVDKLLSGCSANDPHIVTCRKMTVEFAGDRRKANGAWVGYVRTDVVDIGTRVDPCTPQLCGTP